MKLADAVWLTCNAPVARVPIAGRQVMQNDREVMAPYLLGDLILVVVLRELELDRAKTGPGGGPEALQESDLGEHHGQVGSEFRHLTPSASGLVPLILALLP